MVEIFSYAFEKNPFAATKILTNERAPCGVRIEKEKKCIGCDAPYECAHILQKMEDPFHFLQEIWNYDTQTGKARTLLNNLLMGDEGSIQMMIDKKNLELPFYVKFLVPYSLKYGKHLLHDLKILKTGSRGMDKATGRYCPIEDLWTLCNDI